MARSVDIPRRGRVQNRADRDNHFVRREMMGPTYQMVQSDQHQEGEPGQIALREPPGYEHPQRLSGWLLDPGGPRAWPVSQRVEHGDQQRREEAFQEAVLRGLAAAVSEYHSLVMFRDRRLEGRRYRETNNIDDLLGPQESNRVQGWQADVPFERYERGWW